ncbi:MAG TPA: RNA polymerase subunit sigma [Bacteroidetes bacterium]|nr:RNA polymerase subunit sigma [Bacteroidota bacterium]
MMDTAMETTRRDDANWRELRTRLLRFVRSKVRNDRLAEDIVHDTLLKAFQKRDSLRSDEKLVSWLFQIAMNAVRDTYRARHLVVEADGWEADDVPLEQTNSETVIEMENCIRPHIAALPEHYRIVIEKSEIDGIAHRIIAEELGISVSGVKSRVQRGRALLMESLTACCKIEAMKAGNLERSEGSCCTSGPCSDAEHTCCD